MEIPAASASTLAASAADTTSGSSDANSKINDLKLDDFLKLMISEMQNQDPLHPMENTEVLQQMSQIRSISATSELDTTLHAVLLGQNVSSAASLIGKQVSALTSTGDPVQGQVDSVSIANDDVQLHIGDQSVGLKNVSAILPSA